MPLHVQPTEPIATYSERYVESRRTFRLYPGKIMIEGTVSRNRFETTLPLSQVVPEFGVIWIRGRRFYYGVLLFAAFGIFATALGIVDDSPSQALRVGAGVAAAGFLVWGISYFRRCAVYRFVNEGGINVLEIVASGPDRERALPFDELIARTARERKVSAHTMQDQDTTQIGIQR